MERPHEGAKTPAMAGDEGGERPLIGSYRLLQRIGEGGMGEVWEAEQQEPIRRRVALKLIKLGMDSRQLTARFEAERQALALMDHANIARVLDAGTTEQGRPYFVMELVRGRPITEYCDRHRFDVRRRLELFVDVCRAVQHAHQKGIVHRDLKPSNVLVAEQDGRPLAKVIDFGVAKAMHQPLTDKTLHTRIHQIIGTPAYMSPEQVGGGRLEDIDTRADVYSLGALLYELLTGAPPFSLQESEGRGYDELCRRVRETDPPTPSARATAADQEVVRKRGEADASGLRRQLRGELDWITLKALEKDRTRRYETANGLAADVERFLNREPVTAGPPGAAYRLRKLVQRHRGGVAAAVVVLAALVGGLALASWGLVQARKQRDRAVAALSRAEAEARKAAQVNRYLNELLETADPNRSGGEEVTVRELLDDAATALEGGDLADQPDLQAALWTTIGSNYHALGLYPEARRNLTAAARALEREHGEASAELAATLEKLGPPLLQEGEEAEAEEVYGRALEIRRGLGQPGWQLATARGGLGEVMLQLGRYEEAEAHFRRAVADLEGAAEAGSLLRAEILNGLARVMEARGAYAESIDLFERAIARYREAYPRGHSVLANSLNNLATALEAAGRYRQAERVHRETLAALSSLLGGEHPSVATSLGNLGLVLYRLGQYEEAEALQREALAINRTAFGEEHFRIAINHSNLALAVAAQGRLAEADGLYAYALEVGERVLPPRHIFLPVVRGNRAEGWARQGRLGEAEQELLAAHRHLVEELGEEHSRSRKIAGFLADLYDRKGDGERAASWRLRAGDTRSTAELPPAP